MLENNFVIAPPVLWSRQVCICTGTLSRLSMLFQVISLLSRLDGSLETPALDGSEQMLQFFPLSPFLSSLLSTTSRPTTSVPAPRSGGICSAPLCLCCQAVIQVVTPSFTMCWNASLFAPPDKTLARALRHPPSLRTFLKEKFLFYSRLLQNQETSIWWHTHVWIPK